MSPRRRAAGRVFVWSLVVLLLLAVAAVVWVGIRALTAQSHLESARSLATELQSSIFSDPDRAQELTTDLTAETGAARDLTSDPVWRAVEQLPWIGPQLEAVSTVAAGLDQVAIGALSPLMEVAGTIGGVEAFLPQDGVIDTAPFTAIQEPAAQAATEARSAADAVGELDERLLLEPVRAAVSEASDLLDLLASATESLSNASVLLPAMLGAEGSRDYLVLFQNNAEWRSLGGMPGAVASIHTEDGRLTLTAQDTATGLGSYDESVLPLDEDVRALYGERPGQWMQNVTQVPDFSVSGALAQEFWERKHGVEVDGVIAIDPVALSYILEAIGPVELPGGDVLTADNAVQLLLNEVYLRYEESVEQDAFFAEATVAVFDALTTGSPDAATLLEALARAGSEDRLLIWSAHESEQAVLDGTTLQGALPVTDETTTRFGVYVNDGTGSKMDYYMDLSSAAAWCATTQGGTGQATLRVTLTSRAPENAADLPAWITGAGANGVAAGTTRTITYVYLPEGAVLLDAEATADSGFGGGFHDGRQVVSWTVDLLPGESATFDVLVETPATPELAISQTPTLNVTETGDSSSTCEFQP